MKDLYFAFLTQSPSSLGLLTLIFSAQWTSRNQTVLAGISANLVPICGLVASPAQSHSLKLFPLLHTPCPCAHLPSPLCKKIKEKNASALSFPPNLKKNDQFTKQFKQKWHSWWRLVHAMAGTHTQPGPSSPLPSKEEWKAA